MGFLTRCKRPFLFAFLLHFCNMLFSFFLKTFLILFEKQQQAVLDRYAGYIRYFSKMNGYYNSDMEDYIRTKLIESLFKFRLDR